jgi:hypothetical protein
VSCYIYQLLSSRVSGCQQLIGLALRMCMLGMSCVATRADGHSKSNTSLLFGALAICEWRMLRDIWLDLLGGFVCGPSNIMAVLLWHAVI